MPGGAQVGEHNSVLPAGLAGLAGLDPQQGMALETSMASSLGAALSEHGAGAGRFRGTE